MNIKIKPISAFVAVSLLSGCASGILRVDQDLYSDGAPLEQGASLSGTPDNDRLGLVTQPVFITDNTPGTLGRAVKIGDRVEFNTVDHTVPDRYQVVWTGARTSVGSAVTNIILRDLAGHEALRIRYQTNQLDVIWDDDISPGPLTLNASVPQEVRIILHNNGVTSAADVTVSQNGQVILDRSNLEFINQDFSSLDVVEVRTQQPADYYMKDLVVITLSD